MPLRLALLLLLALTTSLPAQDAARSDAMWLGLGLGAGSAALKCQGCVDRREQGVTGWVRFGAALTPDLLLGVDLNTWVRRNDDVDQRIQSLTLLAHYFPIRRRGFRVGAHAGFARLSERFEVDEIATSGAVVGASLGWELRVRPSLSLEPSVTWLRQLTGELQMNGFPMREAATLNLAQVGIGLIWRRD